MEPRLLELQLEKDYQLLRQKLIVYFIGRKMSPAEDYADEVLDRTFKQITDGKKIEDLNRFVFGIAKFVLLESYRSPRTVSINSSGEIENENGNNGKASFTPKEFIVLPPQSENEAQETPCLKECLQKLPADKRRMLLSYYEISETSETYIEQRKELAEQFEMRLDTLYTAICRLRKKVSDCSKQCLENMSKSEKKLFRFKRIG